MSNNLKHILIKKYHFNLKSKRGNKTTVPDVFIKKCPKVYTKKEMK